MGRLCTSLPAPGKPFFKVKPVSFLIFVLHRFGGRGEPRIVIRLGNCICYYSLGSRTKDEIAGLGLASVGQ